MFRGRRHRNWRRRGLLSGITGTGGGIFLSPLLLLLGWTKDARHASGITAPFILANSIAGLGGNVVSLAALPTELPYLVIAALLGALVGTQFGIHWLSTIALQRILAVVVLVGALTVAVRLIARRSRPATPRFGENSHVPNTIYR